MLNRRNLDDKTYEERMQEALIQIPLYSKEWTNFNPSDPGITILENLSALETMQLGSINQITGDIQFKLLKLAGFLPKAGRCARVLIESKEVNAPFLISANQQFKVGEVSFETNKVLELSGHQIIGIYLEEKGCLTDFTYLAKEEIPLKANILGKRPEAGNSVYLLTNGLPLEGEEIVCYIKTAEKFSRNQAGERLFTKFANIEWKLYTKNGFLPIKVKDFTNAFLTEGEIRFRMPQEEGAVYTGLPQEGYVIKGTLTKAEYDIPPRVSDISGFLFEVFQKESKAVCYSFQTSTKIDMYCNLLEEEYISVFCKEREGKCYRKYSEAPAYKAVGRYYTKSKNGFGRYCFAFNRKKFRFAPDKYKNAICIIAYSEEMMRQFYLGTVEGYDNQTIKLPVENIVPQSFSVLAERTDEKGESYYNFLKPNRTGEEELDYVLEERKGYMIIRYPGNFMEAKLYICSVAVSAGEAGNIRSKNRFFPTGEDASMIFTNPSAGTGGCYQETLEEVKKRFVLDMNTAKTAVTAADYEKIIKETPGLCIHKVKAVMDYDRNIVKIAIKPYSLELFPQISEGYRKTIKRYIDKSRLLTTEIRLLQPAYLEIEVQGTIYVKPHFENCQEEIVGLLRKSLDYISTDKNFGELLKFDEIFHKMEQLDCVDYIYSLTMRPKYGNMAVMQGMDIKPADNVLCYPGEFMLEVEVHG